MTTLKVKMTYEIFVNYTSYIDIDVTTDTHTTGFEWVLQKALTIAPESILLPANVEQEKASEALKIRGFLFWLFRCSALRCDGL
jgi:hypothetical protein